MIQSRSNSLVKLARSLRERRGRDESGLFLVEGIHHVGEAVQAGWELDAILYAPDALRSEFAKGLLGAYKGRQEAVSTGIMEYLAAKENPAGILALAHQRWHALSDLKPISRGVALVSPQDPGNIGTILRTMDAAACDVLLLLEGGADPYHPTAIRSAMGASFWIPMVKAGFDEFVSWIRGGHLTLVGSSAHAAASRPATALDEPWLLLLGSEQKGLTAEQLAACDWSTSLPMQGRVSSLNLAVAAGILIYALAGLDSSAREA